jgi:hypothetical protein
MRCHEARQFCGAYLDSELDARTCGEIKLHLESCPDCTRTFEAEQALESRMSESLRRGTRTASFWQEQEQLVLRAFRAANASPVDESKKAIVARSRFRGRRFRRNRSADKRTMEARPPQVFTLWAWLWPNPQFYAGLACIWGLILALHFASIDVGDPTPLYATVLPLEAQVLLAEQHQSMIEICDLYRQ